MNELWNHIRLLDFLNKKFEAFIQKVTVSYDGIIGITGKIADADFGYYHISISGNVISASVNLPSYEGVAIGDINDANNFLTELYDLA